MFARYTEEELDLIVEEACGQSQGAQIYDELRRLVSVLNRSDIHSVVEIGSELGSTLLVWSKLFSPLRLFSVDLNSYPHVVGKTVELEDQWKSWMGKNQTLDVIWGDSHAQATKDRLRSSLALRGLTQVDFLYVDGDHSEAGVEQDYNMYKEFVRSPGIIMFHDVLPYPGRESDGEKGLGVGVYKFWNRFKGQAIDMFQDRTYHKGLRPNFLEIFHDKEKQSSMGYGVVFV